MLERRAPVHEVELRPRRRRCKARGRLAGLCWVSMAIDVAGTQVKSELYGTLADGGVVRRYTLKSGEVKLDLISYGARVVALKTKDRAGAWGDITLGYGELTPYVENTNAYFGVIAGRYANRIAKGRFVLDGKTVQTTVNDGGTCCMGVWRDSIGGTGVGRSWRTGWSLRW